MLFEVSTTVHTCNTWGKEIILLQNEVISLKKQLEAKNKIEDENLCLHKEVEKLNMQIEQLSLDNTFLSVQVKEKDEIISNCSLSAKFLENDDKKMKFYTAFSSWSLFNSVFTMVSKHLLDTAKLSKFDRFMMFILKIRLNLFDEDIAYRYAVNQSTVSRNFHQVLDIMVVLAEKCIHWPSRESLKLSMPLSFRKFFRNCAVIIDCTEVFIERPSDLLARAQVWSNYKHNSTVKFLIGITPQGKVAFISNGWGGRASDKHITENCGLLEKLLPGDVILADRGFNLTDSVGLYLAEIKVPAFTRGKAQLEKIDVDWTRELAIVRVHVEKVIGTIKQKFTILENRLPITYC